MRYAVRHVTHNLFDIVKVERGEFFSSVAIWCGEEAANRDARSYTKFGAWTACARPDGLHWQDLEPTKNVTVKLMTDDHIIEAKRLARKLGYGDSAAYTASSDLPGLYCQPRTNTQLEMVIVRTAEFGMVAMHIFEEE